MLLKRQLTKLITGEPDEQAVTAFYYLNPVTKRKKLLGHVPDGREFIIKVAKY